ncbi:MAG: hypothetical protein HY696_01070 [Deltaproteobacteria bacterium]|nr:hypothetical protein [Deltaproteobacteria bacterium]
MQIAGGAFGGVPPGGASFSGLPRFGSASPLSYPPLGFPSPQSLAPNHGLPLAFTAATSGDDAAARRSRPAALVPNEAPGVSPSGTRGLSAADAGDDPIMLWLEPFAAHLYDAYAHDPAWVKDLMQGEIAAAQVLDAAAVAWVMEMQGWSAADTSLLPIMRTMAGQLAQAYRRIAVGNAYRRTVAAQQAVVAHAQVAVATRLSEVEADARRTRDAAAAADGERAAAQTRWDVERGWATARTVQDRAVAEFVGTHGEALRGMVGTLQALAAQGSGWMDASAHQQLVAMTEALARIGAVVPVEESADAVGPEPLGEPPPHPTLSPMGEGGDLARDVVAESLRLVCEAFPGTVVTPRLREIAEIVAAKDFFWEELQARALVDLLNVAADVVHEHSAKFGGKPPALPLWFLAEVVGDIVQRDSVLNIEMADIAVRVRFSDWLQGKFGQAVSALCGLPDTLYAAALDRFLVARLDVFRKGISSPLEWYDETLREINPALCLGAAAGDAADGEAARDGRQDESEAVPAPGVDAAVEVDAEIVDNADAAERLASMAEVRAALEQLELLLLNHPRLLHQLRAGLQRTRGLRGSVADAWILANFPPRAQIGLDTVQQLIDRAHQADAALARLDAARETLRQMVRAPFLGMMVREALQLNTDLARSGEMISAVAEWVQTAEPSLAATLPGARDILERFQITRDMPPQTLVERFIGAIQLFSATFGDAALRTDVWGRFPPQHLIAAVVRVTERIQAADPAMTLPEVLAALRELESAIALLDLKPPPIAEVEEDVIKDLGRTLLDDHQVAARDVGHLVQRLTRLRDDGYVERDLRGEDHAGAVEALQRAADALKEWALRQQVRVPLEAGVATLTHVIRAYLQDGIGTNVDPVFRVGERRFNAAACADAVRKRVQTHLQAQGREDAELDGLLLRLTIDDVIAILRDNATQIAKTVKAVRKRPIPTVVVMAEDATPLAMAVRDVGAVRGVGNDAAAAAAEIGGAAAAEIVSEEGAVDSVAAPLAGSSALAPEATADVAQPDTGGVTTATIAQQLADHLGIDRGVWQTALDGVLARVEALWAAIDAQRRTVYNNHAWGELNGTDRRRVLRKAQQPLLRCLTDTVLPPEQHALIVDAVGAALGDPERLMALLGLFLDITMHKLDSGQVVRLLRRVHAAQARHGARVAGVNFYGLLRSLYVRGGGRPLGHVAEEAFVDFVAGQGRTVVSIGEGLPGEARSADFLLDAREVVELKTVWWTGDWQDFVGRLESVLTRDAVAQLEASRVVLGLPDDTPITTCFVVPDLLGPTLRAALNRTLTGDQLSTNTRLFRAGLRQIVQFAGTRLRLQIGLLSRVLGDLTEILEIPPYEAPPPPISIDAALAAQLTAATGLTAEQLMAPKVDGVQHPLTAWLDAVGTQVLDSVDEVPASYAALRTWLEQQALAILAIDVPIAREQVNAVMAQLLTWRVAVEALPPYLTEVVSQWESAQRAALLSLVPAATDTLVDMLQDVELPPLPTAFTADALERAAVAWDAASRRLVARLEQVTSRDAGRAEGALNLSEGADCVAELRRDGPVKVAEELTAIQLALRTVSEPRPDLLQGIVERLDKIGAFDVIFGWKTYPFAEQVTLMAQLRQLYRRVTEWTAVAQQRRALAEDELTGRQRRQLTDASTALQQAETLAVFELRLHEYDAVVMRTAAEVASHADVEARKREVKSVHKFLIRELGISFPYDRAQAAVTTIAKARGVVKAVMAANRGDVSVPVIAEILSSLEICSESLGIIGAKTMNQIVEHFADLLLAGGRLEE